MSKIVDFCRSKIGCGYVYGATGWIATHARLEQQKKQYPSCVDLDVVKKWLGVQCYDCAQFVRAAAKTVGANLVSGATSQWNKTDWDAKGTIDTMPDEPGIILYRQSNGKMQHTEVYAGNGKTIGARSSKLGVNEYALNGYKWTHWARLKTDDKSINDESENAVRAVYAVVCADSGSTVFMRSAASKYAPYIVRVPVGETVEILGSVDGWKNIKYNDKSGWMMSKFLKEV